MKDGKKEQLTTLGMKTIVITTQNLTSHNFYKRIIEQCLLFISPMFDDVRLSKTNRLTKWPEPYYNLFVKPTKGKSSLKHCLRFFHSFLYKNTHKSSPHARHKTHLDKYGTKVVSLASDTGRNFDQVKLTLCYLSLIKCIHDSIEV